MGALGSFVIGVTIGMLAIASSTGSGADNKSFILIGPLAIIAITAVIVIFAPSARSAWARSFFMNGIACFALPFAGIAYSAIVGSGVSAQAGPAHPGAVAGAVVGGTLIAGALGFVGFFAGAILLAFAYGLRHREQMPSSRSLP